MILEETGCKLTAAEMIAVKNRLGIDTTVEVSESLQYLMKLPLRIFINEIAARHDLSGDYDYFVRLQFGDILVEKNEDSN